MKMERFIVASRPKVREEYADYYWSFVSYDTAKEAHLHMRRFAEYNEFRLYTFNEETGAIEEVIDNEMTMHQGDNMSFSA